MVQCRGNEEMGKRLWVSAWCLSLVFGGCQCQCAFPPVSLGPAGDCPCKD